MLDMSQINHIRDLNGSGYSVSEIRRITGSDRKTIRKYIRQEDFSPEMPLPQKTKSKLDPYKPLIHTWLEADKQQWYKQRHTAKRVFDRLKEEHGFTGSYPIVQRYVKSIREAQQKQRASQELVWEPGSAQADFGEADFVENGMMVRKKFLALSFPHSNDGLVQIFGGETAECVCQGLLDMFYYIGGVPRTIVFDNATGVGRKMCGMVTESALFKKFRAHHHFEARFCNPRSGWEKGNVERKVGYVRSNLFVPVQPFDDVETYNRKLLHAHKKKASEGHYKKGTQISALFEEDRAALYPLPGRKFHVCRYEHLKADGYGKVCIGGKHYYSTRPEYAGKRDVLVGIKAHYIDIYNNDGKILVRHKRQYGDARTDTNDYSTTVAMLLRHPNSFQNSGVRLELTEPLRKYLDHVEKPVLKDCLSLLQELTEGYSFHAAVRAMDIALHGGKIRSGDAKIAIERMTGYGLDVPPEQGPALEVYDRTFLGTPAQEGGGAA